MEYGCEASLFGTGIADSTEVGPLPETVVGGERVWDLRESESVTIPDGVEKIGN